MPKILRTIPEVRDFTSLYDIVNRRIGLVPTMGALHEGHLELGRKARKQCDCLIYSIFVNPIQFGPKEDLGRYPRDIEGDLKKLDSIGADAVFIPDNSVMYPGKFSTYVDTGSIGKILCGKTRKNHFRGVATVVTKLFNITGCDQAYFGKKDYQQYVIIKKLVRELNLNVDIVGIETVREKDGLAMSSRNRYLDKAQRKAATVLYKSLLFAKKNFDRFSSPKELTEEVKKIISSEKLASIEYAELRGATDLSPVRSLNKGSAVLFLAVRFGGTRLIDNITLNRR